MPRALVVQVNCMNGVTNGNSELGRWFQGAAAATMFHWRKWVSFVSQQSRMQESHIMLISIFVPFVRLGSDMLGLN